jgi:GxxExxY protein
MYANQFTSAKQRRWRPQMSEISGLKHKELTNKIIRVFYDVYNELGHGFLKSVYETAFEIALTSKGLQILRQIEVPVWFRGKKIGDFTADMLVDKSVLLELKGGRSLEKAHEANCSITCERLRLRSECYLILVLSQSLREWRSTIREKRDGHILAF